MNKSSLKSKNNFDFQDSIQNIKNSLSEMTGELKGRTGEMISQSLDDIKEKSTVVKKSVDSYVASKPLKSIGLALMSGLVVGLLARKKNKINKAEEEE